VTLDAAALYPKMAAMRGKTLKKLIVARSPTICRPRTGLSDAKRGVSVWPRDDWHMSFKDLLANDGKYTPIRERESGTRWRCCNTPAAPRSAQGRHADARLRHRGDEPGPGLDRPTPRRAPRKWWRTAAVPHLRAVGNHAGAVRNGNQLISSAASIDQIVSDLAKKKPSFLPGVPTLYTAI
jgi:long-chain acyl-CoA synthetase